MPKLGIVEDDSDNAYISEMMEAMGNILSGIKEIALKMKYPVSIPALLQTMPTVENATIGELRVCRDFWKKCDELRDLHAIYIKAAGGDDVE